MMKKHHKHQHEAHTPAHMHKMHEHKHMVGHKEISPSAVMGAHEAMKAEAPKKPKHHKGY